MAEPTAKQRALDVLEAMAGSGGDLGSMDEALPLLTEFLSQIAAPDFACRMIGRPPMSDVEYPGVEGLAAAWREWGETFETVHAVLEEVRESDDHIVLLVEQIATTRTGAVEIRHPSAMLWRFEGDAVSALEFHLDRGEALRAAGIDSGSARR